MKISITNGRALTSVFTELSLKRKEEFQLINCLEGDFITYHYRSFTVKYM